MIGGTDNGGVPTQVRVSDLVEELDPGRIPTCADLGLPVYVVDRYGNRVPCFQVRVVPGAVEVMADVDWSEAGSY